MAKATAVSGFIWGRPVFSSGGGYGWRGVSDAMRQQTEVKNRLPHWQCLSKRGSLVAPFDVVDSHFAGLREVQAGKTAMECPSVFVIRLSGLFSGAKRANESLFTLPAYFGFERVTPG